jgi:hypothetical protein
METLDPECWRESIEYKVTFKPNTTDMGLSQTRIALLIAASGRTTADSVLAQRRAGQAWGTIARQLKVRTDMIGLKYEDGFGEPQSKTRVERFKRYGASSCGG